jgi:DHA2 family multidrug resistance protein
MMFVLGIALYGTTVLIPQLLQTLMGYTATTAGETMSLGGLATLMFMPIVGILISKVDARYLLSFGFLVTGLALFHMTSMDLQMSPGYAAQLRFLQACGLGFLFIPIQTLSYTDVKPQQNNDVSGLTNLARNIGGSVGTALVATLLARQSQRHQTYLGAHVTGAEQIFRTRVASMEHLLMASGYSRSAAHTGAMAQMYRQLGLQSSMLSYLDIVRFFAFAALCMVPLAFFMKKAKGGRAAMH